MFYLAIILAASSGLLMAFQSPVNATLSKYIGNLEATAVSFSGALVVLGIVVLAKGGGEFAGLENCEWWHFLGGAYGVSVVLVMTFAVPVLGLALSLITMIFGQLIMGMIIDNLGLLCTDVIPVEPMRVAGCAVFAAGMALVFIGKRRIENEGAGKTGGRKNPAGKVAVISTASFVSGTFSALQSPTNAALSENTGVIEASFISFCTGTVLIITVTLLLRTAGVVKRRTRVLKDELRPWMFTGGLYGLLAISFNIIATPVLGVALLMAGILFGQLSGGFVIDTFGLIRTGKVRPDMFRVAGLVLIAVGVVLIATARSFV